VPSHWTELFQEAVERFGDDMVRIQTYVAERLAGLPHEDQVRLNEEFSRVLAFQAPSRPSVLQ
jgi:hypothetical protein